MVRKVNKFCPLCGAENPVNARNCKGCGSPFEESSIREADEGPQMIARKQSGIDSSDSSDGSDSSDSSGGSGSSSSSDSSNASFPRPMAYLLSFSLMFFLAMIYFIIF